MSKTAPVLVTLDKPSKNQPSILPLGSNQKKVASSAPARAPRLYGLDTLRAIAVLMVLVYHFAPSALPGGFIGVDVFFVLSGFLITSLLVQEWRRDHRISLKEFWRRRARRILPALFFMIIVVTAIVGAFGGDYLVGLPAQLVGALTFSSNWVYIVTGASYESALTPALFSNLWSLAVEEQFYVLWPLAVVAGYVLTKRLSGRRSRAVLAAMSLGLASGSAALMWLLFQEGQDPSREYYGTDSHLFGLMLGAFLAFVMVPHRELGWPRRFPLVSRVTQRFSPAAINIAHAFVALLAVVTLALAATLLDFSRPATYEGGLLIVAVATVGLIAAIVCHQRLAQRLEFPAAAWLGKRSYSLYLWHWPVIVVVSPLTSDRAAGADASVLTFVVAFVVSVACAAFSYRFVETPVMRHGLRGSLRLLGARLSARATCAFGPRELLSDDPAASSPVRARSVAVLAVSAALVTCLVAGTAAALTRVPSENSIEASINSGADELAQYMAELEAEEAAAGAVEGDAYEAVDSPEQSGTESGADAATEGSQGAPQVESGSQNEPGTEEGEQSATPEKPKGKQITIVGDSVTLAAASQITKSMKGAYIDAEVSRHFSEAPKILKKLKKKDKLRDFVVISLSTNSKVKKSDIDAVLKVTGDRKVVFVTGHADRSWIKPTNKALKKAAKSHENVFLADWNETISEHKKELASDGIHPSEKGSKRYAKVVVKALTQANS